MAEHWSRLVCATPTPLLFSHSTVGSPAPSQFRRKKKRPNAQREKDAQRSGVLKNVMLPFRTIKKIRQPLEKNALVDNFLVELSEVIYSVAPRSRVL